MLMTFSIKFAVYSLQLFAFLPQQLRDFANFFPQRVFVLQHFCTFPVAAFSTFFGSCFGSFTTGAKCWPRFCKIFLLSVGSPLRCFRSHIWAAAIFMHAIYRFPQLLIQGCCSFGSRIYAASSRSLELSSWLPFSAAM